jgi:proline dehydrogenase
VCKELGLFVRVEMEDSPTTDATLALFEALRERHDNVGIVLQSRLKRTPADIDALRPGPLDVRLVKGIYLEPASIAHTDADAIRGAYVACAEKLIARGARLALATHDEALGARVIYALKQSKKPVEHEFEVLLGVQEILWTRWTKAGHVVRVYVPYGPDWRAYSQRRLRKNPQILRHVMRDLFRRRPAPPPARPRAAAGAR